MADLRQGVEYEITAKDNTGPGVQAATETVNKGAEGASKNAERVAKDFKAGFSPMSAIAAALSGNFSALGQQMAGLLTRLRGVHVSMMQFSLYASIVAGVAKAVSSLVECFDRAAQRAEDIRLDNAAASLETMKRDSGDFAASMERAGKAAEAVYEAQNREVSALGDLTKAYNEFAKAQELALAKTDMERKDIEARYKSTDAANAREVSAEQRRLERDRLDADIERMKEELEEAQGSRDAYAERAESAVRRASTACRRAKGGVGIWDWIKTNGDLGRNDALQNVKRWNEAAANARGEAAKADERIADLKLRIEDAEGRRAALDVKEEAAQYRDAAELQTELNEAWAEADGEGRKEVEEIKEAAVSAAEEVKEVRLAALKEVGVARMRDLREATEAEAAALKEVGDARMRDLREATEAEAAAQQRLAAAKAQAGRAWGWYRDKGSLAAQLEEEKADSAAQAQFEKDFERLRFRRDWRAAKDLSLDQEAVRRVAIAREEEAAAERAASETAANTRRAADALDSIRTALEEE